jgi:SAM-dependent methyltransferase
MFDDLTDVYDAMIDWPKRLANERPFYRHWFDQAGVKSVVDVACGTGRHAAMFHDWGIRVEGADLSAAMVELAKTRFGESADLRWFQRGFDAPVDAAESFDAAICVGNSLALAADMAIAERAVQQMVAAVRRGGIVVIQVLSLWRLPDGPCMWQKWRRVQTAPQREVLILKGVHRCGSRGFVDLVVADVNDPLQRLRAESTPLLSFDAADLEKMARTAGATDVRLFGGYEDQPYDRRTSTDLILVARK